MTENLQHHPANRNFAGEAPLADLLPHVFSLAGLRDRKGRRRINLVQDERLFLAVLQDQGPLTLHLQQHGWKAGQHFVCLY